MSFRAEDDGDFDEDKTIGRVRDPGGPGFITGDTTPVPIHPLWMALLVVLVLGVSARAFKQRPSCP